MKIMRRLPLNSLILLIVCLGCGVAQVDAAVIEFRKIVDTSTPIPGGSGNFTHFGFPVIDGQHIAFQGLGDNGQAGIYLSSSGALSTVVDRTSKIPGSGENYAAFGVPGLEGSNVAFGATGTTSPLGVYARRGGVLETIASVGDPMPGGTESFAKFMNGFGTTSGGGQVLIDQGQVYFFGSAAETGIASGYYRTGASGLELIVNRQSIVPGRTFSHFDIANWMPHFAVDNGQVGFWAFFVDAEAKVGPVDFHQGVFTWKNGSLELALYDSAPKPDGGAFDYTMGGVSLDGDDFSYASWNGEYLKLTIGTTYGVFGRIDGTLKQIVASPLAGGSGADNILSSAIANGRIVFPTISQSNEIQTGLKLYSDGKLTQLIAAGDQLDGKTVSQVAFFENDPLYNSFVQTLLPPGMWENQVAFRAKFTDGSEGIYVATVPEPTTFALATLALIGLIPIARRRARVRHARGANPTAN
jgi:hypothetical protein